jgi:splicing factor 3B subunit 3
VTGIGNILRVYELGQKQLLKKQDNRNFKSRILQIKCHQNRIFVADQQESVRVLKYRQEQGELYIFADDVLPRWMTSFCLLDEDTVAGLDKFENFFVNRLPLGCEEEAEDDPAISKQQWEVGFLNGAKYKMQKIN